MGSSQQRAAKSGRNLGCLKTPCKRAEFANELSACYNEDVKRALREQDSMQAVKDGGLY